MLGYLFKIILLLIPIGIYYYFFTQYRNDYFNESKVLELSKRVSIFCCFLLMIITYLFFFSTSIGRINSKNQIFVFFYILLVRAAYEIIPELIFKIIKYVPYKKAEATLEQYKYDKIYLGYFIAMIFLNILTIAIEIIIFYLQS